MLRLGSFPSELHDSWPVDTCAIPEALKLHLPTTGAVTGRHVTVHLVIKGPVKPHEADASPCMVLSTQRIHSTGHSLGAHPTAQAGLPSAGI